MFVSRGIPTFAELLHTSNLSDTFYSILPLKKKNLFTGLHKRSEHSSNCIICATLLPLMYISSPIRKW